jgi:aromatic ring-cleaving dioxygenase
MGTKQNTRATQAVAKIAKSPKCSICRKPLDEVVLCNWHQGRCPHRSEMIDVSKAKTRFTNLINFIKGKIKWH